MTPIQAALVQSGLSEFSRQLVLALEDAIYPIRAWVDALMADPEFAKTLEALAKKS